MRPEPVAERRPPALIASVEEHLRTSRCLGFQAPAEILSLQAGLRGYRVGEPGFH